MSDAAIIDAPAMLPFAESPSTEPADPALILADTLNRIEAARQAEAEPEGFDWATDDDVIIRRQPRTAVYWNRMGNVVIAQEAEWNDDGDPYLLFDPQSLPALIHKLTAEYESWKRDRS